MTCWQIEQLIERRFAARDMQQYWMEKGKPQFAANWYTVEERIEECLMAIALRLEVFADWKPWSYPAEACIVQANNIRWAIQ